MALNAFKNITVQGNRVTFVNRGSIGGALSSLILIAMQVAFLPRQLFSKFGFIQLFVLALLLPDLVRSFLQQALNLRNSTIFDCDAGEIIHTNTLGISRVAFAEADTVAKVELANENGFYKVTRKEKRFGRGWRLTTTLHKDSPETKYLGDTVIPILNSAISSKSSGVQSTEWTPLAGTKRYRQSGEVYSRFFVRTHPWWFVAVVTFFLVTPIRMPTLILLFLIGGAAYCFVGSGRIRLDVDKGEMRIRPSLQEKTVVVPFGDFLGIYERNSLFIVQQKSIHLRYMHGGVEQECPLCYSYRPSLLQEVAEETEGIISSYRAD